MTTVSDLQVQNKLSFQLGTFNILDCGVRTGKTYWAMNNLKQFSRDGHLNRILYLVDTIAMRDSLLVEYSDCCMDANTCWTPGNTWAPQHDKIGVMCYQSLGMKMLKETPAFLKDIDCICWDECDSIFDFAAGAFQRARTTDFARKDLEPKTILAGIMMFSTKPEYMPIIFLNEWEKIIQGNRIMCIGLSATPERSQQYYNSLFTNVYEGRLSASLRFGDDIMFHNIFQLIPTLDFSNDRIAYWVFSPSVEVNLRIVECARPIPGCRPIEIHSLNNPDHETSEEARRVIKMYNEFGIIPPEYNFVVTTKAYARGQNLYDTRFQWVIINTLDAAMRVQADRQVFPHRCYMKQFAMEVPEEYKNRWLPVSECRVLASIMEATDFTNKDSKQMTWNKLSKILPACGYTIKTEKQKIDGKRVQCYYISGDWTGKAMPDTDFLALANAHTALSAAEERQIVLPQQEEIEFLNRKS